jgi:hypothetical protein
MKLHIITSLLASITGGLFAGREECHNAKRTAEIDARHQREEIANTLITLYAQPYAPGYTGVATHERIEEANASLYDNSNYSEGLTNFALGLPGDGNALREANEIIAPAVPAARRFEYFAFNKADQLEADTDDARPIGADFKEIKFTGSMVQDKLINRGLTVTVDEDEVGHLPNWDQIYTQRVIDRIDRNTLVRNIALLSAAAVNQARTWDTSAGKDPDGDVKSSLLLGGTAGGLHGNRVIWGETAWNLRFLSHRAQDNAGGYASAGLTPEQVAGVLGVDVGYVVKSKVTSGTSFANIMGSIVLEYFAQSGQMPEDASHIKRFVGRIEGGEYRVYKYRLGAKLWRITVERYETSRITALAGIRKDTISAS